MDLEYSSTERIDLTWLVNPDNINITADDFAFTALVFGNTLNGALDEAEAELRQLFTPEAAARVVRLRATIRTINVFFEHLKKKNAKSLKGVKSNG